MKKLLKKEVVIAFIIGIIIASGVTVCASGIFANQVTYKNGKTVEAALNELYSRNKGIKFDEAYLQSGNFVGNVTVTSNNLNSTVGLSITGNTAGRNATKTDNRWEKEIDLTNISVLTFYAKKGTDHGGVYISVDNDKLPEVSYHELTGNWIGYYIDLSQYQGVHTLAIGGGYIDDTGFTTSNTLYCDIRLN